MRMPVVGLPRVTRAGRGRRSLAAAGVVLGALALHGWALWGLLPAAERRVAAQASPVHLGPALTVVAARLPPPAHVEQRAVAIATETGREPSPVRSGRGGAAPAEAVTDNVPAAVETAATLSAAPPSGQPLPVYATRLPDVAELHFALRRGAAVGRGRLAWQRVGDDYELTLDAQMPGQVLLGSASRGTIDAHGVAPDRFVDRRRARDVRAVNFQRDARRITFSGPQSDYALVPGAQDRLSWMLQLPGIVQADATLAAAGARVTMFVAGTRGDAEAWHFDAIGAEPLDLPAGRVEAALHLRREPTRPYDTRVDVWLDPQRQHLPARLIVVTVPGGQATEWLLAGMAP